MCVCVFESGYWITGIMWFTGVWVDQHEPGPHTLWPEALGLFVPLNIIAFFTTKLRAAQLPFQIGLFVVFVVSNIVVFQPWEVRLVLRLGVDIGTR